MSFKKEDIKKIAKLAKLQLSDEEIEEYTPQIQSFLGYIDQLKEVDIEGVEPTAQVGGICNVLREDQVSECEREIIQNALHQGEITEQGFIKAKRVL